MKEQQRQEARKTSQAPAHSRDERARIRRARGRDRERASFGRPANAAVRACVRRSRAVLVRRASERAELASAESFASAALTLVGCGAGLEERLQPAIAAIVDAGGCFKRAIACRVRRGIARPCIEPRRGAITHALARCEVTTSAARSVAGLAIRARAPDEVAGITLVEVLLASRRDARNDERRDEDNDWSGAPHGRWP
ncbi:MAG: hypothetical protein K0S65_1289 [Labilithrix sp.]|nr:hypothetical protein [Labilithrix sp.]